VHKQRLASACDVCLKQRPDQEQEFLVEFQSGRGHGARYRVKGEINMPKKFARELWSAKGKSAANQGHLQPPMSVATPSGWFPCATDPVPCACHEATLSGIVTGTDLSNNSA
jgi:hypothetical protein